MPDRFGLLGNCSRRCSTSRVLAVVPSGGIGTFLYDRAVAEGFPSLAFLASWRFNMN